MNKIQIPVNDHLKILVIRLSSIGDILLSTPLIRQLKNTYKNAQIDFIIKEEFKELEILGGHLSPNAYPLAIKYLTEGLVDASVMVTDEFPLSEYEAAIKVKDRMNPPSIKTVLIPEIDNAG